jgi:K+-sensing histidine kinase KdpD
VTPRSNAELMIRRGRRQADRFHGDLHVVYVQQDDLSPRDREILDTNLACAQEAHAHVEILHGEDPIELILQFAKRLGITQIFVGHSQQHQWRSRWRANPLERLIMGAEGFDVRIFPHDGAQQEVPAVKDGPRA